MRQRGQLFIGTSGYQYSHWRNVFYPEDLPQKAWFEHYVQTFGSVEINNTFYQLPAESTFSQWREMATRSFVFALKFSRYGTHIKKLKDPQEPIARFTALADGLGSHLGPILVQLPGRWRANAERLDNFLAQAPAGYRWALEFRDKSWLCEEVYTVLAEHKAALCVHDMLPVHPQRLTADWCYWRFHGDHYRGSYSSQYLTAQAQKIEQHRLSGRDVYVYFNNDEKGHAVRNARDLRRYCEHAEENDDG